MCLHLGGLRTVVDGTFVVLDLGFVLDKTLEETAAGRRLVDYNNLDPWREEVHLPRNLY